MCNIVYLSIVRIALYLRAHSCLLIERLYFQNRLSGVVLDQLSVCMRLHEKHKNGELEIYDPALAKSTVFYSTQGD